MFDRRHSAHHTTETTVAEEVWQTIDDFGAILAQPIYLGEFPPTRYAEALELARANRGTSGHSRYAIVTARYSCGCRWIDCGRDEPAYHAAPICPTCGDDLEFCPKSH